MAKEISNQQFEDKVLKAEKPVLVDFYAPWCGPCQMMSPIIDELAKEVKEKADVYKVNVDNESALANEYQVMSIPTIIIFKNGKPINQIIGGANKEKLKEALENAWKNWNGVNKTGSDNDPVFAIMTSWLIY